MGTDPDPLEHIFLGFVQFFLICTYRCIYKIWIEYVNRFRSYMYLLQWLVVGVVQIGKSITQFENECYSQF